MGDRQFMRRRSHIHVRVVESQVLDMDKFAPNPHARRGIEEVATLDEAFAHRTAADLLVQSGELILRCRFHFPTSIAATIGAIFR